MKRSWIVVMAGLLALAASAGADEIKMTVGDNGVTIVSCDGQDVWRMLTGLYCPGWQGGGGYQVEEGYPKKTGEGTYELRYSLIIPDQKGMIKVTVEVSLQGEKADFHYTFEVPQPIKLNSIHVTTKFPVELGAGGTLKVGGHEVALPSGEYQKGKKVLFSGKVDRVVYPIAKVPVEITTDPDTSCIVHDTREWGKEDFEVRLNLVSNKDGEDLAAGAKFEKRVSVQVPGLKASSVGTE
jgi:hypothetical protein